MDDCDGPALGLNGFRFNGWETHMSLFSFFTMDFGSFGSLFGIGSGRTIATKVSGPLTLSASDTPLTITSAGGVSSTAAGADAIDGPSGISWTITNFGAVQSSTGWGMDLAGPGAITNYGSISGRGGVALSDGGTITNQANGVITGTGASGTTLAETSGIYISGAKGSVNNAGKISGAGYGVGFDLAGSLTNSGVISGGEDGVVVFGGVGSVTNSGVISASIDDGVGLFAGGSVTNKAGGSIEGADNASAAGVFIAGGSGKVDNSGSITGLDYGALLAAGGTVTNNAHGSVSGGIAGVSLSHGGALNNYGAVKSTAAGGAGADLEAGGDVTNHLGGSISGGYGIFITGGQGAVANAGQIASDAYSGVSLGAGGSIVNAAGGTIQGHNTGVNVSNVSASLTNGGSISGAAAGSAGVTMAAGGSVENDGGGSISGVEFAVFASGASINLGNAGSLSGVFGVGLEAGGSVDNASGGSILGQSSGVFVNGGAATVTNNGSISGANSVGIDIEAGGAVTNAGGASITGGWAGVFIAGSGQVTNAGTISGGTFSVDFTTSSADNRLVVDPGAVFQGEVNGGAGTLELASGTAGSVSGIGTGSFDGFHSLQVDAGGDWAVGGAGNSIGNLINNGAITVDGALDVTGALDPASTGSFTLGSGDILELAQAIGSHSQMNFQNGGTLVIDDAALFGSNVGSSAYQGALLANFGAGSSVDIHNFSAADVTLGYDSSTGLLQIGNGSQSATLDFQNSSVGPGSFQVASDGATGILVARA